MTTMSTIPLNDNYQTGGYDNRFNNNFNNIDYNNAMLYQQPMV
jgi:hypothetical protein